MFRMFTSLLILVFSLTLIPAYASDRYSSHIYPNLQGASAPQAIAGHHPQASAPHPDYMYESSETDTFPPTPHTATPFRSQSLSHGAQVYPPSYNHESSRGRSHSESDVKIASSAEQQQFDALKLTNERLSSDLLENLVRKNRSDARQALTALLQCIDEESENTLRLLEEAKKAAQQHKGTPPKPSLMQKLVRSKKSQATLNFKKNLQGQEAVVKPSRDKAIDLGTLLTMITHKAESYQQEITGSSEQ